jgi:hypothetical protein
MHRHRIRTPERQPDLFLTPQPPAAGASPGWRGLPDATQQAVTALMTRLLITHAAAGAVPKLEGDADER